MVLIGAIKKGAGQAKLRKKTKTNGLEGAKNRGWDAQPKGKKRKQMD